jgi:hypothetical protein
MDNQEYRMLTITFELKFPCSRVGALCFFFCFFLFSDCCLSSGSDAQLNILYLDNLGQENSEICAPYEVFYVFFYLLGGGANWHHRRDGFFYFFT